VLQNYRRECHWFWFEAQSRSCRIKKVCVVVQLAFDTKFVTTVNLEKVWLGPQWVKQAQREVGCAVPA
jgi:hypothetical protein